MSQPETEAWRQEFDECFRQFRSAMMMLPAHKELSAEDCAFLWDVGIQAEEDICCPDIHLY